MASEERKPFSVPKPDRSSHVKNKKSMGSKERPDSSYKSPDYYGNVGGTASDEQNRRAQLMKHISQYQNMRFKEPTSKAVLKIQPSSF
jgi:hypothetical protein